MAQGLENKECPEITPEMIKAGVMELRERRFGEPLTQVVQDVF